MTNEATTAQLAREKAHKHLLKASAALTEAADKIAGAFGIPDNINGLARGEFLGRISFVMSMQRDLRHAGEETFAARIIREQLEVSNPTPDFDNIDPPEVTPEFTPSNVDAMPVEDIPGMTVQITKALKSAGIHQLREIEQFTDEALLKVNGIANPTLLKIRACVAAVRA